MPISFIVIVCFVVFAVIGLFFELSSNKRDRVMISDKGGRPYFVNRNLRLIGNFNYKTGKIFYHCFSIGPLPLFPIGCYLSKSKSPFEILSAQKFHPIELFALYARWGWPIAIVQAVSIITGVTK